MSWQAIAWNIFLFAGCGYVVFGLHESGWWFLLAAAMALYPSDKCECDSESERDQHGN